jgi:hypothetical protein
MPSFEANVDRIARRILKLEARSEKISSWRVGLFIASSIGGLALGGMGLGWPFQIPTIVGFAAFVILIFVQDRIGRTLELFRKRMEVARKTRALSNLDWANISPLPKVAGAESLPRYFSDLDLLSGHSLIRLVNHTVSTAGFAKLIGYFNSNGVGAEEIRRRQNVAREAARLRVLRRRFLVIESLWSGLIESDRILELLQTPLHTPKAVAYFYLIASIQATFLIAFALFSLMGGQPYFLAAGLALLIAYRFTGGQVKLLEAYGYGMSLDVSLGKFAALAEVLGRMSATGGPHLKQLLTPFAGARNPRAVLARASRVVGFLGVRQNYILHIAVNLLMPWDFYWTLRLEKVRKEVKDRLPLWLETLSDLEVFISLAEFQVTHPHYVFPQIDDKASFHLRGRNICHPLLSPTNRVGNDLELNADQRSIIITGSNMSGKSTFLRSLGVNLLLAKAGAVVCADEYVLRNLDLATSLRLNDSLEDGLSSFYAEVRQLKNILDRTDAGIALLYLIDEVFRGTNNRERLIGSQAFVKRLAKTQACGLITTHDLELSQLADANPNIRNMHFKEDIVGDRMSFSYKLASGPCPTTNALRVMKLAGLPIE